MATIEKLASRVFSAQDQRRFAELTGDVNPMHMDAIFARRTQAGAPVVHGIHAFLWLLDAVAKRFPDLLHVADFKIRFGRFIYLDTRVEACLLEVTDSALRVQIVDDASVAMDVTITLGTARAATAILASSVPKPVVRPQAPIDLDMENIEGTQGRIAFATSSDALAKLYPDAARILGPRGPAALGCSSFLVGMLIPGLQSIYGSLSFSICDDVMQSDYLDFKVTSIKTHLSTVRMQIYSGGIAGEIEAFIRRRPAEQTSMAALSELVSKTEFAGADVLVVGGSRGLGELAANFLAAGGANVTISYSIGSEDANSVASKIRSAGGACEVCKLDMRGDVEHQLASFRGAPTHVYYFATPSIFRQRGYLFSQSLFDDFNGFYVSGFYKLYATLSPRRPEGMSFFYPSTVAVDNPPPNLLEYAMSKSAAELMCAALNKKSPKTRIVVSRLPRLPTDQTASLMHVRTDNPVETLLPLVRVTQRSATEQ